MKGQLPALAMHRHRHAHVLVEHCFRRYKLFSSKVFPEIVFFRMWLSWLHHSTDRSAHLILEGLLDNALKVFFFFILWCFLYCSVAERLRCTIWCYKSHISCVWRTNASPHRKSVLSSRTSAWYSQGNCLWFK